MSRNGTDERYRNRRYGCLGRGGGGLGGDAQRNGVGGDHVNELRHIEIGMHGPARHRVRTQSERKTCRSVDGRVWSTSPGWRASV